jgi:branched-chain amino acid transport system substrate-binding protein
METGTNALRGVQLAQEQINKSGGILGRQIELVVQDTREMDSPANAVSAYRQLRLDSDIELFVGPSWTVGGLPVAPIAARDNVVVMAPSIGLEGFNEASDNLFNLWPHDSVATKALAQYAIDHGWKGVYAFG